MEFTVCRYFFPHSVEGESENMTMKFFPTFEKALKYGKRYTKGSRFSYFEICNDNMETIYSEDASGNITQY